MFYLLQLRINIAKFLAILYFEIARIISILILTWRCFADLDILIERYTPTPRQFSLTYREKLLLSLVPHPYLNHTERG